MENIAQNSIENNFENVSKTIEFSFPIIKKYFDISSDSCIYEYFNTNPTSSLSTSITDIKEAYYGLLNNLTDNLSYQLSQSLYFS